MGVVAALEPVSADGDAMRRVVNMAQIMLDREDPEKGPGFAMGKPADAVGEAVQEPEEADGPQGG